MMGNGTRLAGTASGTALSSLALLNSTGIIQTILLATIGATASFVVTLLLQRLWHKRRK